MFSVHIIKIYNNFTIFPIIIIDLTKNIFY